MRLGVAVPNFGPGTAPVTSMGYMEVGRVVESRTPDPVTGQLLAMRYGHANRHTSRAPTPGVAVDREFVDVVRGTRPATTVPYEEALRTHRVACAVAESLDTGAPVAISPA